MIDYKELIEKITKEVIKALQNSELSLKEKVFIASKEEVDAKVMEDIKVRYDLVEDVDEANKVFILNMSNKMLYDISNGVSDDELTNKIIKSIMKGKDVCVLKGGLEFKQYESTCPKELLNRYKSYIESLNKYKVKFVDEFKTEKKTEEKSIIADLTNKNLINEKVVSRATNAEVKSIRVDKKALITPLAKDFIRSEEIEVKRV